MDIQLRHLIPELNVWADRAFYITGYPIALGCLGKDKGTRL